ncbi:hypothetical protein [Actinoplanes sp. M2I2]|uniref:hypothetical protein n=1 Tax=Actinoplanes sp. M2I2 TaxID=1734444 RepID=UPI002021BDCC|nr:hypothetical protein [Actinoplanes sp. M2I2]
MRVGKHRRENGMHRVELLDETGEPIEVVAGTTDAGTPATKLAATTVNRILAAVSSFYEYLILAGRLDTANPIEKRPDPALARVSERHQPFMGRASRQRPVRRAVRVKTVQRVPRPLDEDQVIALLGVLRCLRDRAFAAPDLGDARRPLRDPDAAAAE